MVFHTASRIAELPTYSKHKRLGIFSRKRVDVTYQTPPVSSFTVANALDDLRGKVLGSTTVRVGASSCLVRRQSLFTETKVCDLDVAFMVKQHVLWFQITIDNAVLMEAAQCLDQLCCVETSSPLAKLLVLAQMIEKLSTIEEVHDKVQLCWGLERILQLNDEWTIDLLKNVSLSYQQEMKIVRMSGRTLGSWLFSTHLRS